MSPRVVLARVHRTHGERRAVLGTCVGCVVCWRVVATDDGRAPTSAGVSPCVRDDEMIALMARCDRAGARAGWMRGGQLGDALRASATEGGRHAAGA